MIEIGGVPVPVTDFGAGVLLGIAIWLILTGRLVPRSTYDEKSKEADKWQAAHSVSEEARHAQTKQLDAVMEVGQTVKDVLTALERARTEDKS